MKKIVLMLSAAALVASTSLVMAKSEVKNSKIINSAKNKNVLNAAIGAGSKASVGSVTIKNSKVKNSKIINSSKNRNVLNAAIGAGSTADTGSVRIE